MLILFSVVCRGQEGTQCILITEANKSKIFQKVIKRTIIYIVLNKKIFNLCLNCKINNLDNKYINNFDFTTNLEHLDIRIGFNLV